MMTRPDIDDLYDWVEEFFGNRIDAMYQDGSEFTVGGILYETFELRCSLDERYRFIGLGILVGRLGGTGTFFGKKLTSTSDRDSTRANLATVDRWCRAHLPAAFLDEYDASIAADPEA
jgi:hypothetical protein